jgi:large repetitive protein
MLSSGNELLKRNSRHLRREARTARKKTRLLALEKLEPRQLLAATDLAAISGRVFRDANANGFTPGEQVVGATLNLYRDANANGALDAGDGAALRSATSDSNGLYRFDRLTAGDYFVQQPAQTVSGASLAQITSTRITISSIDAQGAPGLTIDGFTTRQTVTAPMPVGTTNVSAQTAGEALGGERDMLATLTGGQTGDSVTLDAGSGLLAINAGFNALGQYKVTWDGVDNNATSLNPIGLRTGGNGVDLTSGGTSSHLEIAGVAEKAGGAGRVRIYTDANNFSQATVTLGVNTSQSLLLSLTSDFTAAGGSGANFANVGAIELQVDTTAIALDGQISALRMIGSRTFTTDFNNQPSADLSLAKTTSNPNVDVGQTTSFTLNLLNSGPDTATNVAVTDLLPVGLNFVSATASQGSYNAGTGIWTIGAVPAGTTAILQVTTTVTGTTAITNMAQISASDQLDPDSTPNNNNPSEDDQSSITLTPQLADLSLSKTINNPTVTLGQPVTFTLNVNNAGPSPATNVTVTDQLPQGLTFVSATPAGVYNSATGVWTVGTLANGASASLQITASVGTSTAITNTAQISASDQRDPDSTPGNNIATEDDQGSVTITPQVADLSLAKTIDNPTPNAGQNVTFTLNLNNAGPGTATSVAVTDKLPPGLSFISAAPSQGSYDSLSGVWTVGSVSAGSSASLQLAATVNTTSTVVNTAQVTRSDQPDPDSTPNNNNANEDDQSSISVTPQRADLSLTKTVDNATPNPNDIVTFTLNLRNAGPGAATNIAVTDLLPSGATFVGSSPSQGAYNNTTGIWSVGVVGSGSSASLQIGARITGVGTITNTAEVTAADQPDPDSTPNNKVPGEDDQSTVTVVVQQADLSLAKTVTKANPQVGENVTFTITLSNGGPNRATNVAIRDELPSGMTYISSTASTGSYDNLTSVWNVPAIENGTKATLQITAKAVGTAATTNTAEVIASDQRDPDSTPNNNVSTEDDQASLTVTPQIADLSLTKTANPVRPVANQQVTFTITVTNAGPSDATGVTVKDDVPAGMTFVSATANVGSYDRTNGVWTVGKVSRSGTATLTLVAKTDTADEKTNAAEITASDQYDPDSQPNNQNADEDDQASVTISPQVADLSLTKATDRDAPNVGDNVTFTITLNNAGPDAATGVKVKDVLPAGFSYVSSTAAQGSYSPQSGEWNVGTVTPGTNTLLYIVGKVTSATAKINDAEVIAADQFDPDSTPGNGVATEDDQATITATPQIADLSLGKVVDKPAPNLGENITFVIGLNNAGPDTATNVTVLDRLPAGVSYVSSSPSQGTFDPTSGRWTVGSVSQGTNVTLRIVAKVTQLGAQINTTEIVAVDQFDNDSTPGNGVPTEDDQASVTVTPQAADLSLTQTIDTNSPNVGDDIRLTLTLANAGPDTATSVVVAALLPDGLAFVSATASAGSYDSAQGRWNVGPVPVGDPMTLEIVAKVESPDTQAVTAEVVEVDQADPDSKPNNQKPAEDDQASVSYTPQVVDLKIAKVDFPDPVYSGRELSYTITVSNAGPSAATEVVVTDTLPTRVTFVSATASQGTVTSTAGTVVAQLNTLAINASATITVIVQVESRYEGPLINQAEIQGRQYDSDTANNTDTTNTIARLPPARIAGTVFLDLSTNGVQNTNDPPIAGVLLELNGVDRFQQPVTQKFWTGPDGKYEFEVEGGVYVLTEQQPNLFNQGNATNGTLTSALGNSEARVRSADEIFFRLGGGDVAEGYNFWETVPVSLTRRRYLASS